MATPTNNFRPRKPAPTQSPSSSSMSDNIIGQFRRMDHIGKGSFAEVYRGIHIVCSPASTFIPCF